jgi:hypothetical protein
MVHKVFFAIFACSRSIAKDPGEAILVDENSLGCVASTATGVVSIFSS